MSDTNNSGDKTLAANPPPKATLHLKSRPVEAGIVRQSFSHGRSKAVVVEKVKRRTIAPGEAHPPREPAAPPQPAPTAAVPAAPAPAAAAAVPAAPAPAAAAAVPAAPAPAATAPAAPAAAA